MVFSVLLYAKRVVLNHDGCVHAVGK